MKEKKEHLHPHRPHYIYYTHIHTKSNQKELHNHPTPRIGRAAIFLKSSRIPSEWEPHKILGGIPIQRAGTAIEKGYFLCLDRQQCLIKGTQSTSILSDLTGQKETMEDR